MFYNFGYEAFNVWGLYCKVKDPIFPELKIVVSRFSILEFKDLNADSVPR